MATILVVEDHAMSRQMLKTLLGYKGHQVLEAADGTEALTIAYRNNPDLIISDILLPKMNGIELVRQLRSNISTKEIPFIFYTAIYRLPESISSSETFKTCSIIPKPSDPGIIFQTIDDVLGISSSADTVKYKNNYHDGVKSGLFESTGLRLAGLMDFNNSLFGHRNPKKLLSVISQALRDIMQCRQSLLVIQDNGDRTYYYTGPRENDPVYNYPAGLLPPEEIIERLLTKRAPVRWLQNNDCTCESVLSVPFASSGSTYGWISLIDKIGAAPFLDSDAEIAITLSTQAAFAYENILLIEQLEKNNETKSMFIANISHELRTPLNILLSSTQLLNTYLQNIEIPDSGKILKKINLQTQNCNRLLRIINNLIDITKIDSGHFDLFPANCNIVEIVEAITLSVVEYAGNKGIEIVFDTEDEEIFINCDLDSIERIILNLLSNAIKFTSKGGTIYVNVRNKKGNVQISVRDTGIGIYKDKLDLIFQTFTQVDNSLTRNHEGSGIGLSLVKQLVELHGGTVTVFSEYQKGSEFIVELPVSTVIQIQNSTVTNLKEKNPYDNIIKKVKVEFSDIYF